MLEGPFAVFLTATIIGLALSGGAWWLAKRSGLLPVQQQLISTLQSNVEALQDRVQDLEREVDDEKKRADAAQRELDELNDAVVDLVRENSVLRRKLGLPTRRHRLTERDEVVP